MNLIDKLYTEWAWRTKTGTPSMANPEDKAILDKLIKEFTGNDNLSEEVVVVEADGTQYDQVIAYALFKDVNKVNEIPSVSIKYTLGSNDSVNSEDLKIWKELYSVKPPKIGKEIGTAGSLGAGNGEVALYWLLSRSGYTVTAGAKDEEPDLTINNETGLEVKAYGKRNITLGRFGKDYDTRKKLGLVLGLDVLISNLTGEERAASIDSFNKDELIRGFATVAKFSTNSNLRGAANDFEIINEIYQKIDSLTTDLGLDQSFKPKEGAAAILRQLLETKAEKKPGYGGYMVDVSEDGKISYIQITKDKVESLDSDTILKYVSANGSALKIYPEELFK